MLRNLSLLRQTHLSQLETSPLIAWLRIVLLGVFVTSTLLIILTVIPVRSVHADVNDFDVTSFKADYYLGKQSPHGSMRITERISVDFRGQNHGILRAIPKSYNDHPLNIKIASVKKADGSVWPYTTYDQAGNLVLKIGDPDSTVTGQQQFNIDYSVENVATFYDTHDELFWDINGDQWSQKFLNVEANFHLGEGVLLKPSAGGISSMCLTGKFGSNESACIIDINERRDLISVASTRSLYPFETMSVVLAFDKGTFAPYTWRDTIREHLADIIIGAAALVLLVAIVTYFWRVGKDYDLKAGVVAEYGPPKGVDVLQAGILDDYKIDGRDITAGVIDLAVHGYVRIKEVDHRILKIFKRTKVDLVLINADTSKLSESRVDILKAFFPGMTKDEVTPLGTYQPALAKAIQKIEEQLAKDLTDAGMFDKNPKKTSGKMIILMIIAIALCVLCIFFTAFIALIVSIIAVITSIVLMAKIPRRSRAGQRTHQDLQGLKLYIKTAEKDRLAALQSSSAPLAVNAHEPVRSVELFEKLLPYAIIFGLEKTWAKQFESIYNTPPDWYVGNWATFSALSLTNSINTASTAMSSSFTAPSSSGGSGFSGGSAGGGGGGGGGGGW